VNQANRLILNTLATYARMVLTVGIGLATTRLLLATLGEIDFGIFAVLGGGLSLLMIVSTALAASAQRHLAYEIGRKNELALREVFSTSVVIYLVLGFFIAALGLALRPAFLHGLTLPDDRLHAAGWVYNFTLLNMAISVLVTPYMAVFVARQAMIQDAFFAILTSVAGLLAILFTPYVHHDNLIGYAVLITVTRLTLMSLQVLRGLLLFPEARFARRFVRLARVRELVGFAGWSFLGQMAWTIRAQGATILLNVFFGPVVNASYAVANQATSYMTNFSNTIVTAARPAITAIEGAGRRSQVHALALTTSKLTVLASSLIAVPIMLDPQAVLQLWLGRVPPYADSFIPLLAGVMMVIQLLVGHTMALAATGDIGKATRYHMWITLTPLPIAAALFYFTPLPPPTISAVTLLVSVGNVLFNILYIGYLIQLPFRRWFDGVARPLALTVAPAAFLAALPLQVLQPSGLRAGLATLVYAASLLCLSWFLAIDGPEKQRLIGFAAAIARRVGPPSAPAPASAASGELTFTDPSSPSDVP
jgi:O-antigen/teichoic acid export membrane protein